MKIERIPPILVDKVVITLSRGEGPLLPEDLQEDLLAEGYKYSSRYYRSTPDNGYDIIYTYERIREFS